MNYTLLIFLILLATTVGTTGIGAGLVAFFKKGNSQISRIILGFAAGIMLVASFLELLEPAIEIAEEYSTTPAWLVVTGGFLLGCFLILILDLIIGRIKNRNGNVSHKQSLMLATAISLHNIPEGFAIGVLLGALGNYFQMQELWAVIPILVAIGLHNLPEGTVVSVSFMKSGMSKMKSFLLGQVAGLVQFIFGIIGYFVVINVHSILPYAMSFAAGAMIWVAAHELIPESQENKKKHPYLATIGIIIGIAFMLILDMMLPH